MINIQYLRDIMASRMPICSRASQAKLFRCFYMVAKFRVRAKKRRSLSLLLSGGFFRILSYWVSWGRG